MPIRRPLLALLLGALLFVVAPAAAHAAWFPADSIDGPGDVVSVGDVDLEREGTGGLVYLKRENGVAHVYLARMIGGAWRAPERVDAGFEGPATAATIAAGAGRRLMIAFVSSGKLYGSFAPGGDQLGPLSAPQLLAEGSADSPVTDPHSDMGINGTGYVIFAAAGDVRAARLQDTTWEGVPTPLDVDPAQTAGAGEGRPRIAVSAEGNAVATWAESAADGRRRVFGRRVTGLVPSAAPQEISLPDLAGAPGGPADSPDIDIEDDGSYAWVTWRQDFGGVSRTVARRLVGSLFETPVAIDGGAASVTPRFEMNGRGIGAAVAANPDGTLRVANLDKTDAFTVFGRLDGTGGATLPAVAVSERRQVGAVWRREAPGGATIQARYQPDEKPFEAETTVSVPAFGAVVGGPEISTDKSGDFAVAFMQGEAGARRLVAAVFDKPASVPVARSTERFQRRRQPVLKWAPGTDLWGGQQFKVFLDGVEIGTTEKPELLVPAPLPDGPHRWRVQSVDRRGQAVASRDRLLRIDTAPPRVRLRVTGTRKRNRTLTFAITAADGKGSGIDGVRVDYGDRSLPLIGRRTTHRYTRPGSYTVAVRVTDRARNVTRTTLRLRIKR